ncbi:MAG: hypothetical protein AABX05_04310 [Nanoarchaeota archaeon]
MYSILGGLIGFEECPDNTFREIIGEIGFKKVFSGRSSDHKLVLDDHKVREEQLVIVGYDADLDLNPKGWLTSYQQKSMAEPFTVYSLPFDILYGKIGSGRSIVNTSVGQQYLPSVDKDAQFIALPLKRDRLALFISVISEAEFPAELLLFKYLPPNTSIFDLFGENFDSSDLNLPKQSSCVGRLTLPTAFYTVRGREGTEYVTTKGSLETVLNAQQEFIDQNMADPNLYPEVKSARDFFIKYSALL